MKRIFSLLYRFGKTSLLQQMAYRPSFLFAIVGKTLRVGVLLIFFKVLYLYTPFLGTYSSDAILVLIATYLTLEFLVAISFHRNLAYYLPAALRQGTFDLLLTKPINTLFHTSFRVIDFMDMISFFPVLVLWVVALGRAETITLGGIVLLVLFILLGYVFAFSFLLLLASSAFWTITATGVGRMYENILRLARYPSSVFQGGFRLLFFYIIPISAMTNIPAEALLGRAAAGAVLYFAVYTIVVFFAAVAFWKFAIRHYSSASS